MTDGVELRVRRVNGQGWPTLWRNLLRGQGIYDCHRDKDDQAKRAILDRELSKFGGRLLDVNMVEVVFWFPHEADLVRFRLTWE